jgi:hypothetical protein
MDSGPLGKCLNLGFPLNVVVAFFRLYYHSFPINCDKFTSGNYARDRRYVLVLQKINVLSALTL